MNKILLYTTIIFTLILMSCPQSGDSGPVTPRTNYLDKYEIINESDEDSNYRMVLTNYGSTTARIPLITVDGKTINNNRFVENYSSSRKVENHRDKFDRKPKRDLIKTIKRDTTTPQSRSVSVVDYDMYSVGDTHRFWLSKNDDYQGEIPYDQNFKLDSRTTIPEAEGIELFIWVDTRDKNYPAEAITKIEEDFHSIYNDMTDLFGVHWGDHNNAERLPSNNKDIHILLTDIHEDKNSSNNGFTPGYQYSYKDTFINFNYNGNNISNQNHNFVMDSHFYFHKNYIYDEDKEWRPYSYNSAYTMSTVIHEYQHMIHFYNKALRYDFEYYDVNCTHESGECVCESNRFINEMFSMTAEDILAKKYSIQKYNDVESIYYPDYGRLAEFNLFWDLQSSFNWDMNELNNNSYSTAYVMGAYLIRNYGISPFQNYFNTEVNGINGFIEALNTYDPNGFKGSDYSKETILKSFGKALVLSGNNNDQGKHYRFNNKSDFIIDSSYTIKPLDLINISYWYNLQGTEKNRLYTRFYKTGGEFFPMSFMSLYELSLIKEKSLFLKESNIYLDLGLIKKGSKIEIYTFDPEVDLSYFW